MNESLSDGKQFRRCSSQCALRPRISLRVRESIPTTLTSVRFVGLRFSFLDILDSQISSESWQVTRRSCSADKVNWSRWDRLRYSIVTGRDFRKFVKVDNGIEGHEAIDKEMR